MRKIILSTLLFLNIGYFCFGQDGSRRDKLESIQIAWLTKELSLSPEEAQKFWPIYNDYREELMEARKETKDDEVLFEEKVLNIKKKYKSDFKKVLGSDQRVNQVFTSEKSFRELLRRELLKRRNNQRNFPNQR